jgi:molybdopterin-dependent oxidoreductase alpha subunit
MSTENRNTANLDEKLKEEMAATLRSPLKAPYGAPAAGIGALTNSAKHLLREKALVTGPLALRRMNQPDGFDCPGCAWPEPGKVSHFEFCENGVKAMAAESTTKKVTREFFAAHTVTELRAKDGYWLEQQGRLTEPMAYDRAADKYVPISWQALFARLGGALGSLENPDEAVFYTSGRTSNEAAFLYQLLGRSLGTNNFPDCSNMCHESSGVALNESVGVGKGTVTLEDFEKADAIFVVGQNPGTNHPRMLSELEAAAKRGCRIVVLNPLRERGLQKFLHPQHAVDMMIGKASPIATLYLQPLVGGDFAVFTGMLKDLLGRDASLLDHAFIAEHTAGFEEMAASVRAATWESIEEQSGLTRAQIRLLTDVYAGAERVIACWAMGLTQNKHAVATIQQLTNLMLARGNVGREGAGLCPVRGHSNVQGDRTMGIYEKPAPAFLDGLDRVFGPRGFTAPRAHGYDVVEAIAAMHDRKVKVFIAMGGNFAEATPDSTFTEEALRRCGITAHVSTKLNRSHLITGGEAYILPCLGRSEKDVRAGVTQSVTVEDSMSMVHASTGRNTPASPDLLSEPAIVCGLARAALPNSAIPWEAYADDYSLLRDKIAEVLPAFAGFNDRIRRPGGFYLGNSAAERRWTVAGGKARFTSMPLPTLEVPPGALRLMTLRSHDQYNTTIYGLDDRYRGIYNERRVVLLNPLDVESRGLVADQIVDLVGVSPDGVERVAEKFRVVEYDIPKGCAAAYFPETNVLVPLSSFADKSQTPLSKFIPITLRKRATSSS